MSLLLILTKLKLTKCIYRKCYLIIHSYQRSTLLISIDYSESPQVSMEVADGGKTYYISGLWNPAVRDLLVLNTETPKGRYLFNVIDITPVIIILLS